MLSQGRSTALILLALVLLSCAALLVCPFIGIQPLNPFEVLRKESFDARIFWELRVPRVLLAYAAGAALAVAGVVFQALFRNVLATPFTLGVSSGAACGVAVYIHSGLAFAVYGVTGQMAASFMGAVLTVSLVYVLARATRLAESISLLLAGVVLNFFFSSLILFLQFIGDYDQLFKMTRWMIGSVEAVGFTNALILVPFALMSFLVVLAYAPSLDLISIDEELAAARGVRVRAAQFVLYAAISLSVAALVAVCGVISFVGIVVPCVCRMLIGPKHSALTPAAFMGGGVFVTLCDAVARSLFAPAEIPVGVITALLGGPFFLWLLVLSRRGRFLLADAL